MEIFPRSSALKGSAAFREKVVGVGRGAVGGWGGKGVDSTFSRVRCAKCS